MRTWPEVTRAAALVRAAEVSGCATTLRTVRSLLQPWAPARHRNYHARFRSRVALVCHAAVRLGGAGEGALWLPPELWLAVLAQLAPHDWDEGAGGGTE